MNINTGETYPTLQAALDAGVPRSDIAEVVRNDPREPEVRFSSGPFKNRVYKRTPSGQLVRVAMALIVATLACSGCGSLSLAGPSATSKSIGACQTAGSMVNILDVVPGC